MTAVGFWVVTGTSNRRAGGRLTAPLQDREVAPHRMDVKGLKAALRLSGMPGSGVPRRGAGT